MANQPHDGALWISTGRNRKDKSWKNIEITWKDFCTRLKTAEKTSETYAEYIAFDKSMQDEKKDVGGFVGGTINGGRRKAHKIVARSMITLDIDYGTTEFWEDYTLTFDTAAFIYATHKHSKQTPRYRLIMPLAREVQPDEYQAIARKIAGIMDIELFDPTTFQPERLMYWPSTPKDVKYYWKLQDGPWLDPDWVLRQYRDWKDTSQWPVSRRTSAAVQRGIDKQGEPAEKPGVIGAFNRSYTITEAIDMYLGDVYTETDYKDRYTYAAGSTSGGLVIYGDKFAYSHHGTDPVSGKLCNAFDLVRIHLYGLLDEDSKPDTPVNKLPSQVAMQDFALKDGAVSRELSLAKLKEAGYDFADIEEEEMDWVGLLAKDAKGTPLSTAYNVYLILKHDPHLKDCFAYNEFENREVALKDLPWRSIKRSGEYLVDSDDSCLRNYVEKNYKIASASKVEDAFAQLMIETGFHPVRDYLRGLTWDGKRRVDTLFIDYLGAEDSDYTRAVTRKGLVAAVARVFVPGIKYETVPTLIGPEGKGKSTIIAKLGKQWYSNSLGSVDNPRVVEQLQGVWLIEIAELAGLRKSDVENVKAFIGKQDDRFRVAYGRRTENFPRQCVFFGSTNTDDFLMGANGNRRFWPIVIYITEPERNVFTQLTPGEINQIWAEAVDFFDNKEPLMLDAEMEKIAFQVQEKHTEKDPRWNKIKNYLELEVPENWYKMTLWDKREFIQNDDGMEPKGVMKRNKITVSEIWSELFKKDSVDMSPYNVKFIRDYMKKQKNWKNQSVRVTSGVEKGWIRV